MSLSETHTQPWIRVQEDGTAVMAHFTCKAGLGEVCSHAAALIYAVLTAVDKKDGLACTQMPRAWIQPSTESAHGVPYEENCVFIISVTNRSPSFLH